MSNNLNYTQYGVTTIGFKLTKKSLDEKLRNEIREKTKERAKKGYWNLQKSLRSREPLS